MRAREHACVCVCIRGFRRVCASVCVCVCVCVPSRVHMLALLQSTWCFHLTWKVGQCVKTIVIVVATQKRVGGWTGGALILTFSPPVCNQQ